MLVRTGQARPPDVEGGIDPDLITALRPRASDAGVVDALPLAGLAVAAEPREDVSE